MDSIFRNIRGVEKWLRGMCTFFFSFSIPLITTLISPDIDTTVVSLQMEGEDVDYHQDLKSSDSEGEPVSFPYCMEWSQHQHVVMKPCFHAFRNFTHHFVFTIKRKVPYVTFH